MRAQVVSFHCVLKDKMGRVISSTFNQDVLTSLEGDGEQLLKALAEGLQDLKKGERRRVVLTAEQAYGFYDPELVIVLPRKQISHGKKLHCGQEVLAESRDGGRRVFRVTQIQGEAITLDANHPLAGQDLVFDIEATEARDATRAEIEESSGAPNPTQYLH